MKPKRHRKPIVAFRPSPDVEKLLNQALRKTTWKTKTRIIEECIIHSLSMKGAA
jgi:hypothetical protein